MDTSCETNELRTWSCQGRCERGRQPTLVAALRLISGNEPHFDDIPDLAVIPAVMSESIPHSRSRASHTGGWPVRCGVDLRPHCQSHLRASMLVATRRRPAAVSSRYENSKSYKAWERCAQRLLRQSPARPHNSGFWSEAAMRSPDYGEGLGALL